MGNYADVAETVKKKYEGEIRDLRIRVGIAESDAKKLRQQVSELKENNDRLTEARRIAIESWHEEHEQNRTLQAVVEAANKRRRYADGEAHHVTCNFQTFSVEKCNCGVTDLHHALEALEEQDEPCNCVFVVKLPDGENAHIHSSECPKCQPPGDKE